MKRHLISVITLSLLMTAATLKADEKPILIEPQQAKEYVGELVTTTLQVNAAKVCMIKGADKPECLYLDSKADFHDPQNLAVYIPQKLRVELGKQLQQDDLADFLLKKYVQVTGKVTLRDGRAYLDVSDLSQLAFSKEKP